jgi:hypothetical protein
MSLPLDDHERVDAGLNGVRRGDTGGRWAPKKSEAAPLKTTPVHSVVA